MVNNLKNGFEKNVLILEVSVMIQKEDVTSDFMSLISH